MTDDWLIMKRGLFFRPNACGYTGIRDEAGRYSHEEALKYDDCTAVRESDAPEFTAAAFDDLVIRHLIKQRDALAEALAAQPRLLTGCLRDGVCRGVCRDKDCQNYDLVVAARVCVFPKEDGVVYPEGESQT